MGIRSIEINPDFRWEPVRENNFVRDIQTNETYYVPKNFIKTVDTAELLKNDGTLICVNVNRLTFFPTVGDRIKIISFEEGNKGKKLIPDGWNFSFFKAVTERCGLFTKNDECTNIIIAYEDGEIENTGLPCVKKKG